MLIAKGEKKEICFSSEKVTITFSLSNKFVMHEPRKFLNFDDGKILEGRIEVTYNFISQSGKNISSSDYYMFFNLDMIGEEDYGEQIKKKVLI